MAKTWSHSITVESMRDVLQGAGLRAELVAETETMLVIRSASNGVNFEIRLFNPVKEDKGSFTDAMFMAGLTLKDAVAPEFLNRWNSIKRFGRLYASQGHLILALDIFLQGGVSLEYLRSQLDIWDRLLQGIRIRTTIKKDWVLARSFLLLCHSNQINFLYAKQISIRVSKLD